MYGDEKESKAELDAENDEEEELEDGSEDGTGAPGGTELPHNTEGIPEFSQDSVPDGEGTVGPPAGEAPSSSSDIPAGPGGGLSPHARPTGAAAAQPALKSLRKDFAGFGPFRPVYGPPPLVPFAAVPVSDGPGDSQVISSDGNEIFVQGTRRQSLGRLNIWGRRIS